jgi:hypothetical protein
MQPIVHGKKQYLTLLVLSAIFILLIPLIYYIIQCIDSLLFMKNIDVPGSLQRAFIIIYHVNTIFVAAGSAVSIFAFVRYRFKLCLPFIAVALISSLVIDIASLLFVSAANKTGISFSTLASPIFQIAISLAIAFLNIGIAKTFSKHVKNEIVAVSLILLVISIFNLFQILINYVRIYFLTFVVNKNPNTINWSSFYHYLFLGMPRTFLSLLYSYIYIFVAYLILWVVYDKRDKVPVFLSNAKTVLKRLWDSTAN